MWPGRRREGPLLSYFWKVGSTGVGMLRDHIHRYQLYLRPEVPVGRARFTLLSLLPKFSVNDAAVVMHPKQRSD